MPKQKIFAKVRIDNIHYKIALWELTGRYDQAQGLRSFFSATINEAQIEHHKTELAIANDNLNYTPKQVTPPPTRKTGIYLEPKTIKRKGKTYHYEYWNVYSDGFRKKTFKDRDKAEAYAQEMGIAEYF